MRMNLRMMSMAAGLALMTGACAPKAKPFAYVGGAVLSLAGTAMFVDAASADCTPEDPFIGPITAGACAAGSAIGATFGAMTLLTGLSLLVAAAVSPSGSDPAPEAAPLAPLDEARPAWAPLPPARSPSAPSGSPLSFH